MSEKSGDQQTFTLLTIGHVRGGDGPARLEIAEPYRPAMAELHRFSHVIVIWWAHQHDNEEYRSITQGMPPYADGEITGVFACRSEYRPNPIALTTCQIEAVDEVTGTIDLAWIDAVDGTPILDLKAYFPVSDRVRTARTPPWCEGWPEWVEDAHLLAF